MAFSLSKLFKPKPTLDPLTVLNQIDYKEGTKYAENDSHKVYVDIEELGGFPYLKTMLFGTDAINVKRTGCTITFVFKNGEITLSSDNTTVESNEIQKSGVYYTPVDFELNEDEVQKIKTGKLKELKYSFKKSSISLKPV